VLGALSLAADMALGLRSGHGVRATYIGMHIADELGLPPEQRVDLFYAELLMDAGCTAWTTQMAATILGNDIVARRELFFDTDPSEPRDLLGWLASYMATASTWIPACVARSTSPCMARRSWSRACSPSASRWLVPRFPSTARCSKRPALTVRRGRRTSQHRRRPAAIPPPPAIPLGRWMPMWYPPWRRHRQRGPR
jgi:hypothetical protein